MSKAALTILLALVAVAVAAVFFVSLGTGSSAPKQNANDGTENAQRRALCKDDVSAAKKAAQGKICTQQFQTLRCPHTASFTYGAPNGCQIGFLKGEGWTLAGRNDAGE